MAKRSSTRRSQRRLRVTVAAVLLMSATAFAVPAIMIHTMTWLMASTAVALVFGFAATRIVYSEMLQGRREIAVDRARQADAYRIMFAERARDNVAFAEAMSRRIATRDRSIGELEGTIRLAEKRADVAEHRVKSETLRADEATELLTMLQRQLEISDPELLDELAVWAGTDLNSAGWEGTELHTVIDLLQWEEGVMAKQGEAFQGESKKQA